MWHTVAVVLGVIGLLCFIVLVIVAAHVERKRKMDEIFKDIRKRKVTYIRKDDTTFVRRDK